MSCFRITEEKTLQKVYNNHFIYHLLCIVAIVVVYWQGRRGKCRNVWKRSGVDTIATVFPVKNIPEIQWRDGSCVRVSSVVR